MKAKTQKLPVVNPHAAGIDIGSRFHLVAVGQAKEEVRQFGVYTDELETLYEWLVEHQITTVAMESTGPYWKNVFDLLQS